MYEKLEICPSCGHPQFNNYLICEDYAASHESFALVKCTKCELVFTNPRPNKDNISKYYQHDNYISHTNRANNITNVLYKLVRKYTLYHKKQLIQSHTKNRRLLDFGCGPGVFARYMQNKGYDTVGYEPSTNTEIDAANTVKIHKNLKTLSKENKFDIITAWHVLEHVHNLGETIKTLKSLLNKSGLIVIAVPNIDSDDCKHYKKHWAGYDVPRHLYHFNPSSLKILMAKKRFAFLKSYPMFFDAMYVSILSEKYIESSLPLIKGIKQGIRSNNKANKSNQYSSIIYIFQK